METTKNTCGFDTTESDVGQPTNYEPKTSRGLGYYPEIEVVAAISNPCQYESRYELYKIFKEDMKQQGVKVNLWTIELQHGDRPMKITTSDSMYHIQLWTSALPGLIWYKENLQNISVGVITQRHPGWRYIAFVDADFKWEPDAFRKTVDSLQHYDIVQMWSHLINLDPNGGILNCGVGLSFMYCWLNDIEKKNTSAYEQGTGSPGGAWAFRRDALNKLGSAIGSPLIDWNIIGGGDRSMACALINHLEWQLNPQYSKGYMDSMIQWQAVAQANIKQNVGYVDNTVRHMWHGRVADRGYDSRWKILVDYKFDPITDLKRDSSGVWQLVTINERQWAMRDALRRYFFSRKEDATTL